MSLFSSTVLLKKRKRTQKDSLVLHLSSSPSPSYGTSTTSESEFEPEVSQPIASTSTSTLVPKRKKLYPCVFEGCDKVYAKPSRLAEHQRSHTGDRPFQCAVCGKEYLRESHLQAHSRSHLPNSARPFVCEEPGCEKRFWTAQHLRAHTELHRGDKPYQCTEPGCEQAFAKHHQLRDHLCTVHAAPGTKPYQCDHANCTKSFSTNQKLRAHLRTHDERRYTCVHESCRTSQLVFPTWTALQHHMRTTHPPVCPHPECNGKTFTAQKNLRTHLKIHEQRNVETELRAEATESDADSDSDRPKKRRRGGEVGRDWLCDVPGCGKDFKSKNALTVHNKVAHLGQRDFVCPHQDCQRAFGYKHLLQRHVAKLHTIGPEATNQSDVMETRNQAGPSDVFNIDDITGVTYGANAKEKIQSSRTLQCPYPCLQGLFDEAQPISGPSTKCEYIFSRAYDLHRHLRAIHSVDVGKERVDQWVRIARNAKLST